MKSKLVRLSVASAALFVVVASAPVLAVQDAPSNLPTLVASADQGIDRLAAPGTGRLPTFRDGSSESLRFVPPNAAASQGGELNNFTLVLAGVGVVAFIAMRRRG